MQLELALDGGLTKLFDESKGDTGVRWVKVVIKDEKLVADGTGKSSDKPNDDMKALAAKMASEDDCFYGVVRGTDECEWIVLAYIPDTSKVNWEAIQEAVDKKKGRVDNTDTMTGAEKENAEQETVAYKEAVESFKGRGGGGGAHTIKFPLDDAAKEGMAKVGKGEAKAVVVKNENEKLVVDKIFESGDLAEVVKSLGDESRFIVVTHEHEGKKVCVFIYYASDTCPFKKRMQYAASKAAVVEYATEAGCDIAKSSEYTCKEEITDAALTESLAPVETEAEPEERKSKPKAPGRGGMRMLIA